MENLNGSTTRGRRGGGIHIWRVCEFHQYESLSPSLIYEREYKTKQKISVNKLIFFNLIFVFVIFYMNHITKHVIKRQGYENHD